MALRARLQSWFVKVWQRRGLTACLLSPLAALHHLWWRYDVWRYRSGLARPHQVRVPVVVVGNLYVGGTGKTPLTIELTRALRERGWSPGVISRGYGAERAPPRLVMPNGSANDYGDEPLLIARAGHAPVAVGTDRVAAARLLLNLHPHVDVIVADDGLQHRRLARNVEIALVHEPGFGNGWMLPAGPLREPPERLDGVDAVVLHGVTPPVRIYSPFFRMNSTIAHAYSLKDPQRRFDLGELALEQRAHRQMLHCGGRDRTTRALLRDAAGLRHGVQDGGAHRSLRLCAQSLRRPALRPRADHRKGRRKMRGQSGARQ